MAKTKSSTPQAAPIPGSFDAFIQALANDPEFKRMNPNVRLIDGKLEHVAPEPEERAPLVDPGGKRRDKAMAEATYQMEALFEELIAWSQTERDAEINEYIVRALAIRGRDLNNALMSALRGELDTEQLEELVYHGAPIQSYEGDNSVKSAKSKAGRSERKVAAAA